MSDTAILGIGTFASKLLVFLLMPFYTEYLSPGEYGTANLISQTANLLIPLACAGICDGLFRFTLDSSEDKPSVLKTGITVLGIATAIFIALSPILFFIDYFDGYAWLIVIYVLAANIHSAFAQYIRANDRPKLFALQGIINTSLVIIFNLIFLLGFDMGVTGYVLSVVVADTLVSVFLFIVAKLHRDFAKGKFKSELMSRMVKYSVPMIPTTVFWWITNVSDRFIITWICGEAVNGLYSASATIPTIITLVGGIFYEAWQFSAVKDAEQKTKSDFFGQIFSYYSSLLFAAGAAIVLFCRIFVVILMAEEYSEAWQFIPTLTMASLFSALTTFIGSAYLVKKKSVMSFLTSMAGAVINLILNILMIPVMGAQGAAIATVISYVVVLAIRTVTAQKYIRFKINYILLMVNSILLVAQCAVTIAAPAHWWLWSGILVLAIIAVNAKSLLECVVGILRQLFRKRAK